VSPIGLLLAEKYDVRLLTDRPFGVLTSFETRD